MASLMRGVAYITGAGSGIGQSTAYAFARHGIRSFALLDRNPLTATMTQLKKNHADMHIQALEVDVTSEAAVNDSTAATVKEFGRIDHAANNAGRRRHRRAHSRHRARRHRPPHSRHHHRRAAKPARPDPPDADAGAAATPALILILVPVLSRTRLRRLSRTRTRARTRARARRLPRLPRRHRQRRLDVRAGRAVALNALNRVLRVQARGAGADQSGRGRLRA
ncbi:hypothetical protein AOQ84DRAFT_100989, partial [Glonium stellatum]